MKRLICALACLNALLLMPSCNSSDSDKAKAQVAEAEAKRAQAEADKAKAELELLKVKREKAKPSVRVGKIAEQATKPQAKSIKGIHFGFWGTIGDADDAEMTMDGLTGTYSYGNRGKQGIMRTLKFVSYDKASGHLVLNAYLKGEYIGKFDGHYSYEDVDRGGGDIIGAGSYSGKFISVKGVSISFSLYCD